MARDSFLKYLTFEKRYSPHTIEAYANDLNQFAIYLKSEYDIEAIKEAMHMHIRSWIVSLMQSDISPRSINRKLSSLKAYFKYLQKRGVIKVNPTNKVIAPKPSKKLPVFLKEKATQLLFEQIEFGEGFEALRDKLILELLYGTGMRRAELIGLTIANVDLAKQVVKILGKGNKERLVPFGTPLKALLIQYLEQRKEIHSQNKDRLFLTDKGNVLYPKFVYNVVQRYLSAVTTQEKRSPHVLRHTFATHLMNEGANLNAVKELLGHSSLASTQVYTHNSIEKLKQVYKQAHPKAEATLPKMEHKEVSMDEEENE